MIVRQRDDTLFLIDQNEYGRLAGELARNWGNEEFAAPDPIESVVLASAMHDEGWRDSDAVPLFNAAERRPLHFRELPVEEHIALYRSGVHAVAERDPYAGVLVGMHWAGLYRGRWGIQPRNSGLKGATPEAESRRTEVIAQEERRWAAAKERFVTDGVRRAPWEAQLWHNFELVQAVDLLSLYASAGPHDKLPVGNDSGAEVGLSLGDVEQAPGERRIPAPTRPAGPMCVLVLRVREPGIVSVDPYPFADGEVVAGVSVTVIHGPPYQGLEEVRDALASATTAEVSCTFVPPEP